MKPKHLAPAGARKATATKPPPSPAPEHRPTQNAPLKDSWEGRYANPHPTPPPFPCGSCPFHLAPPFSKRSTATMLSFSPLSFLTFFLKDASLLLGPSGNRAHFSTSAPHILPLSSWGAGWHSNINSRATQADFNSLWDSLELWIVTALQRDARKSRGRQRSANTPPGHHGKPGGSRQQDEKQSKSEGEGESESAKHVTAV